MFLLVALWLPSLKVWVEGGGWAQGQGLTGLPSSSGACSDQSIQGPQMWGGGVLQSGGTCVTLDAGEGKGSLLQCSCLENPMDRGVLWATVHGVSRVRHDLATKQHHFRKCVISLQKVSLPVMKAYRSLSLWFLQKASLWKSGYQIVSLAKHGWFSNGT